MSYLMFKKPLDAKKVLEDMNKSIIWYKKSKEAYDIVKAVLFPKWDGKKITKRMFNDASEKLTAAGFRAIYDVTIGQYYIKVKYEDRDYFSFFLGYDSEGAILTLDRFLKSNGGWNEHDQTAAKMEEGKPKIDDITARWNAAIDILKGINKEAEAYNLQYTFDINER